MEDFEFKPLTDGLGFHKKIIDLKEHPEKFEASQNPGRPKPTPTTASHQSLWRPALKSQDIVEKKIEKKVEKKQIKAVFVSTYSALAQADTKLERVSTCWPAAIFDSTMVLGLVLIFSAIIFAVTRIDFGQLIEMLQTEGAAQLGAVILLISVYEIYTVTCRTFFGKTVGESVFECRLGTHSEQESVFYPLKVALRSLAIALTGFILLPLLSTILNADVAGFLSGVSLYSEKK